MWPSLGSSLRTRIALAAGLLFLFGIGLTTIFVTLILHDEMQAMLSKQQLTATDYIARDIDAKLKLRMDSLKRVADNFPIDLLAEPVQIQAWLEDRKAIHTLFPTGLMIVPANGGPPLADTPRLETRPKTFVDRDWFMAVTTTRQAVFSKPLVARATGQPAIVVAIPILDTDSTLKALLIGITPLATPGFLDLIQGTRPSKSGRYQLISPRHQSYALTSDAGQSVQPLPETGRDTVIDRALHGTRGISVMSDTPHGEELTAIVEIPQTGWLLIARSPTEEAFAPVRNSQRNSLLIAGLLALPMMIVLLAVLNRLLSPISRLAEQLHGMAEGSLPMQPLQAEGHDEIADVANSFNHLQSKLLEQENRLAEMAHHDTLTGLPNRHLINDRLESELKRIRRSHNGLSLLFMDLDGFKPVNDQYGHQVGDLLLCEVASRLLGTVRDMDTVARLGGDEFLILISDNISPKEAAERVAQSCIESLRQPIMIGLESIRIGVSIGISNVISEQASSTTPAMLMQQADSAMYRAKAAGRNCYAVFEPDLTPITPEKNDPDRTN